MRHWKFIKNFFNSWAIYLLVIAFTFIYAIAAIIRHSHFESFAFDLGIYDQAIWLYSRFKVPYSTIKEMIVLGDHFAPSLVIFAPFYWLWDDVRLLLFLQAFIVCLGAFPVFKISQRYLENVFLSLIISFSYLVYFGLQNALLFDFHAIVVATGIIPWVIYFCACENRGACSTDEASKETNFPLGCRTAFRSEHSRSKTCCAAVHFAEQKKWRPYFILIFILIFLKEDVPIITASIGLFLLLKFRAYKTGFLTILISLISFFLITKILIPNFNPAGFPYQPKIPLTLKDWWLTFTDPSIKIRTMIISFLPFFFLPLFSGSALIPIFIHFLEHFPGKDLVFRWDIYLHYRAPLAPFMAIATIYAISSLKKRLKKQKNQIVFEQLCIFLILTATVFTQYYFHLPLNTLFKKAFYQKQPFVNDINYLIKKIPQNASLSTQNNIAPHVSHREKIYLFPKVKNTDYILLDLRENQPPNNFFAGIPYGYYYSKIDAENLIREKKFKIIDKKGGVILLRRNI